MGKTPVDTLVALLYDFIMRIFYVYFAFVKPVYPPPLPGAKYPFFLMIAPS